MCAFFFFSFFSLSLFPELMGRTTTVNATQLFIFKYCTNLDKQSGKYFYISVLCIYEGDCLT